MMALMHKQLGGAVRAPMPRTLCDDFVAGLFAVLDGDDDDFGSRYLKRELLSKYVDLDPQGAERRKQAAITKWLLTEERNLQTNIRLYSRSARFGRFTSDDVIRKARSLILWLLGETPPFHNGGAFTSGASMSHRRMPETQSLKYVRGLTVTENAVKHARFAMDCSPVWGEYIENDLTIVNGNSLFTVPKNSEIDRCAAKEPDLNMYLQKEVGDWIRRALRRVGIDLNDQSLNRDLARKGSVDGSLATIDLSSASDSVTTSVVYLLLPTEWVTYMDDLRSPYTCIDGVWHENQMFSSMGNAFTFELETLIFWALTRAVCYFKGASGVVSVYGDDIVCPSSIGLTLKRVFGYFGFVVNTKKSCWEGGFRESCGGHYYNGVDITPFYIRGPMTDVRRVIHVANQFRLWCSRRSLVGILDPRYYGLWLLLARHVPRAFRGGHDLARSDILVSYGELPTHALSKRKDVVDELTKGKAPRAKRLTERCAAAQAGMYMRWLDEADRSNDRLRHFNPLVTSCLTQEYEEDTFIKVKASRFVSFGHDVQPYPQELGIE